MSYYPPSHNDLLSLIPLDPLLALGQAFLSFDPSQSGSLLPVMETCHVELHASTVDRSCQSKFRRSEDCTHLSQESPILESPTHLLAGWTKERFEGDLKTLSHNRGSGQLRYPVCKHKGVRERGQASTCVRVTMCTMLVPSSAVTSRLPIST